ncbi:hypothetical protein [Nonomuraea cavernae]|uniref:Uncharacterized protein n=1 Tax=Nonomuraea cavernae TaxID=2045107 RepID=A0A917YY23_9ACTN|nr:hypothetical protein [Nonomuraea cavernae]MCA2185824.1 hypothetical protein [Nonomuraea cavernae]GGO69500.1 hypothetical protein GCM10012289_30790 [Nonomuraea cavernae]
MPYTTRAGPMAALLGLALGCLALGPALGWGFVLAQDMVFVPDPAFSRFTFGLAGGAPRVVPSDAVVTALSWVIPGELVQKAILLGIFVLGCSGAALLVPSESLAPRLVAGAFYVWNPYVAERLLMGQWALLLGYAGLPWVVGAVVSGRRQAVAILPAAVGGFAAMTITALTALPLALTGTRRWAGTLRTGAIVVAFSLPWLLVAALRPDGVTGDGVGVEAFAARADGPFGAVGSLLSLGGIWNSHAVPAGYDTLPGAVARLALAVAGIAGFAVLGRVAYRRGLAVAAAVGFAIACLGVTEPGRALLTWLIGVWGGFAVFRDAQQFVAPLALLAAVGLGLLTASAASAASVARRAPVWAGVMVLVPLAVLPTLAWGAAGALRAVSYPADWTAARELIRRDGEPGDILVLPFESYRRFPWNGHRAVLDPAQRFFAVPGRDVVSNDTVRVGSMVVGSEDGRARQVERVLVEPSPNLLRAGFRYVVVDAGTPDERRVFEGWLRDATLVVDGVDLRLYRLDRALGQGTSE